MQFTSARMEDINDVFDEMRAGKIDGRIVLEIGDRPVELSGARQGR
jgi:D-arabinose 1-dehydrogenase-like Zn-dependent alcohol dehydrogenase